MTIPDRWQQLRDSLAVELDPTTDDDLEPRDRAELWQLLTTYDAAEGRDQLTAEPLALDDALIVVAGALSNAVVVHRDTWAARRQEVIETLTGLPVLSTIDGAELAERLS